MQFDAAMSLCAFVQDPKQQQQLSKQLTVQKGVSLFSHGQYVQAFALFLKSKVDPLSVLYLFTDPSYCLIEPTIAKQ